MNMRRLLAVSVALLLVPLAAACGGGSSGGAGSCTPALKAPGGLVTPGALTIGSDMSYPPQEFDPNNPQGFDLDLGKALAQAMCLQVKYVNQGFAGIIPALNARKFDVIMSAMTITDARKQVVSFVPYFNAGEAVVAKKSRHFHITELTQLCGLTVAVEDGTAEEDEAKSSIDPKCPAGKQLNLKVYPTDTDAFAQLLKGTVDAHFTDDPVAYYDAKRNSGLQIVSPVLETAPEGIAVRKTDAALVNAVQAALTSLEKNGTYTRILKSWNLEQDDIRKAS
jgi:polar amino acid transport system substrate-binding protein